MKGYERKEGEEKEGRRKMGKLRKRGRRGGKEIGRNKKEGYDKKERAEGGGRERKE
jgi:hypothetical protein